VVDLLLERKSYAAAGSIALAVLNARSVAPHLLKIGNASKKIFRTREAISAAQKLIMALIILRLIKSVKQ